MTSFALQLAHLLDSRSFEAALRPLGGHVVVGRGVGGRVFSVVVGVAIAFFYGGKHSPIITDTQQNTEQGLFSLTPLSPRTILWSSSCAPTPVPFLHLVPDKLSCPWTSWELLLQRSPSSVNSSLPSMLIVCWCLGKPEVWNGPGEEKRRDRLMVSLWREKITVTDNRQEIDTSLTKEDMVHAIWFYNISLLGLELQRKLDKTATQITWNHVSLTIK